MAAKVATPPTPLHMKVKSPIQEEHGQIVESYDNLSHLHHLQVHMLPIQAENEKLMKKFLFIL